MRVCDACQVICRSCCVIVVTALQNLRESTNKSICCYETCAFVTFVRVTGRHIFMGYMHDAEKVSYFNHLNLLQLSSLYLSSLQST
jgi:hypothetical protein